MQSLFGETFSQSSPADNRLPAVRLLIRLEPRPKLFLGNLFALLSPAPKPPVGLRPGVFWPDVFVARPLPWPSFFQSTVCHALLLTALWGWSQLLQHQPRLHNSAFDNSQLTYYTPSEYLPPLDTGAGQAPKRMPQHGDPEYAKQEIISVPPQADNRTQTIITPPDIKLDRDVPLPNIVAWSRIPEMALSATGSQSALKLPLPYMAVIAPPPQVDGGLRKGFTGAESVAAPTPELTAATSRQLAASQAAVIAPAPSLDSTLRPLGDLSIGKSDVVMPAPDLPMAAQRALPAMGSSAGGDAGSAAAAVVPPPPSVGGSGRGPVSGQLIALGIHPVPPAGPVQPPQGNRRGEFAATPQGKAGASGRPEVSGSTTWHAAGTSGGGGNGNGHDGSGGHGTLPPGIRVGSGAAATGTVSGDPPGGSAVSGSTESAVSPRLLADAKPPRVGEESPRKRLAQPVESAPSEEEKKVFGPRRFYSMTLNMPNLNSAGGSWVIRFAELQNSGPGELFAPEATKKVDPAYPAELMRTHIQGTVTLYAVIHSDGSVGDVRVLNGIDERLDLFAQQALARWRFRPAIKNGSAVALEAVVKIPFIAHSSY
jgi:TonB family protein